MIDPGQVRFEKAGQNRWASKISQLVRDTHKQSKQASALATRANKTIEQYDIVKGGAIEQPPRVQNFKVYGGFTSIVLQWDFPEYAGHRFTRIYRSANDSFGSAEKLADVASGIYSDDVGADKTFYYWARHYNRAGDKGAINATNGTMGQTAISYDMALDDAMASIMAGLDIWQTDVLDAMAILDNRTLQLVLETDGQIEQLISQVSAVSDNLKAAYDNTVTAVANEVGSAVTKVENLSASIYEQDENGNPRLDENGEPVFSGAFIDHVDTVLAGTNGELMAAIGSTLTITKDGSDYSLSEVMQVSMDLAGTYTGQWGVKTSINELIHGVGFVVREDEFGQLVTQFSVSTDQFVVHNPTNGDVEFPFVIDSEGRTLIKTALIDRAVISQLVADTIITEQLFAAKQLASPRIVGGAFEGGTLNIANKTTIDANGLLTAINAVIQGRITATAGEMENVRIKDTCTVEGTVYADNIEGDVLDRSVIVVDEEFTVGASSDYTMVQGEIVPGRIGNKYDRYLTISGLAFDHQNGGGSSSNFEVALYIDGAEVQRFNTRNVNEEGSVTVTLGTMIPKNSGTVTFRAVLETDVNDNILVQPTAILIDVVKIGSTIRNVTALYAGPDAPAYGQSATPVVTG